MGFALLILPLLLALAISIRWRHRPVLRALVVIPSAAWLLLAAYGMWAIRHKPVFGNAPEFGERYDDYVAGADAMSNVLGEYYFLLSGAVLMFAAAFVLDGFLRQSNVASSVREESQ